MKDNHQLDRLFQDKLASAKVTPPAEAWDAIATNVNNGKSKKGIYLLLAIAASFSLLCALTWVAWKNESKHESIKLAEVSKNLPEFKVKPAQSKYLKVNIPNAQVPMTKPTAIVKSNDPIVQKDRLRFIADIQPLNRRSISLEFSALDDQKAEVIFTLPPFITDPESFQEPRGIKFSFIRSLASVAKGVNEGQKALSGIRKSKIEFINEELKFDDPEKKSKVEATLQEDSPSNQQ